MTHACTTRLLALALCALGGCVFEPPEVGALQAGACNPHDSDPEHTVSFRTELVPIFQRPIGQAGCSCHLSSSARQSGIVEGGLDMTSYAKLMRGGLHSSDDLVLPGDPCGSVLLQSVSGALPFSPRMPVEGPPYLSPAERTRLADWIAEGAHDN